MPVVVEFEFGKPAVDDAKSRLGLQPVGESRTLTEVLAVGYNEECRQDSRQKFEERLRSNEEFLTVQIVSGPSPDQVQVWPDQPLVANIEDLQAYIEYLQVPQQAIDEVSSTVAEQIKSLGSELYDAIQMSSTLCEETLGGLRERTGAKHRSTDDEAGSPADRCPDKCNHDLQATRTACTIWLIAIDLQNDLALYSSALHSRGLMRTSEIAGKSVSSLLTADDLLDQWKIIFDINYLPVVELAISTLALCEPFHDSLPRLLNRLDELRTKVNSAEAKHVYNFAGELWQRIVAKRKETAAFYTKPHIAELLATIGAERFNGLDPERLGSLNILDAACGTGTLIGAGERAIRRKYSIAGGDDPNLHKDRMEHHIFAMDINGIAGTLTAKRLTDLQLDQEYSHSNIAAVTHEAGSLMLMDPTVTGVSEVLGFDEVTPSSGIGGDMGFFHVGVGEMDWALMNPPYSRTRRNRRLETKVPTKTRNAAKRAGFNMADGQAGNGSFFGDVSNIRLRRGGVFAHVLPLTAAKSGGWGKWRNQLIRDFENIVVISAPESMSDETSLREMLVVATKKSVRAKGGQHANSRPEILCVDLFAEMNTLAEGYATAKAIARLPDSGVSGEFGLGRWNRIAPESDNPWMGVGTRNDEMTTIIASLINGEAWDPMSAKRFTFAMTMSTLGVIVDSGPSHERIGHPVGGDGRGAFEWSPISATNRGRTHKGMWSTKGFQQPMIKVEPTHSGRIVDEHGAREMATHQSHWLIRRELSWSSHAIAAAHCESKIHGGRSWNGLQPKNHSAIAAAVLFFNRIFGAIIREGYGSNQQNGRSSVQISVIPGLQTPAFTSSAKGAERARMIATENFDRLSELELMPFAFCFMDTNRHEIDNVVADMLGLDPDDADVQRMLQRYRVLFASEPNVNAGKKAVLEALEKHEG